MESSSIELVASLKRESESNDIFMHYEKLSNMFNSDRISNATHSNNLNEKFTKISFGPGSIAI